MNGTAQPRARFDVERMVLDMTLKGWNNAALAREAQVSAMTVSRFLKGEAQTAPTASKLATALGQSVARYLIDPSDKQAERRRAVDRRQPANLDSLA